ncbi:MAG: hypothetical protein VKP62_09875 [Candidatus Sericytochromatia bacterium]|nr:hypothetical protein [Candidatus Sericytochromatia bacterium]
MHVASSSHHPQPTHAPAGPPSKSHHANSRPLAAAPAAQHSALQQDEYAPSGGRASSLTLPDGKPAPEGPKPAVQPAGQAGTAGEGASAHRGPQAARQPDHPAKDATEHAKDDPHAAEHGTGAVYAKDSYEPGGSHAMDQVGAANTGRELGHAAHRVATAAPGERLQSLVREGSHLAHGAAAEARAAAKGLGALGSAAGRFVPGLNAAVALNDSRHAIEVAAKPGVPGLVKGLAAVTAGFSIVAAGNLPVVSHAAGVAAGVMGTAEFAAEAMLHGAH